MMDLSKLKVFLEWLITPQNDKESSLFKENECVDDYIHIKNRIETMTEAELIEEINKQLNPYGLEYIK